MIGPPGRIQNEIREAAAAGIEGFQISIDNLSGSRLNIPFNCKTFETIASLCGWRLFLIAYFVTLKRNLRTPVTKLPVEIIRLLKPFLVSPCLALRVEIQFPPEYPFREPTFLLHNDRNYILPRNVTAFFAEQKFYGKNHSPACTLVNNYLPLIKEECEREIDEENETGDRYYRPSCAAHVIRMHILNKAFLSIRDKKVRYCHRPLNHYKTIMEAIPKEFRGKGCHRIMWENRDMTNSNDEDWRNVNCGDHFDVFLGRDFEQR
jgi:hypothetical protein